ncbi:MAG TPA: magnesium transporter CorA family protein [Nitrososphaera sp.]|nr:magnesium transporter CorA family protein [Nitrososphaera sp.]
MASEALGNLKFLRNNGFTWIDVSRPAHGDMRELGNRFSFHELNLDDCLSKVQIPKIDRYEDHLFIILHFPTIAKETSIPRSSQLCVFIGKGYLVTVHQGDLSPLVDMFELCAKSNAERQDLMGRSSGYLFHSIVDALVDNLIVTIRKVIGNFDDIEDEVFNEKISVAKEISHLRRQITSLRRMAIPLKRTVLELSTRDMQRFSEEDLTLYFDDVRDHIDKAIEELEESKEVIEIYKDTDFMHGVDKSNKILAVLTIIFTLSIPATLIGSFYGMNVSLPGGVETGLWTFLGEFTTFIMMLAAAAGGAIGMTLYFRRLGWV